MKLVLSNDNMITYISDLGINDIVAEYDSLAAAQTDIAKLTPENLEYVEIRTDDNLTLGKYYNLILNNTDIINILDESGEEVIKYEVHFHLREKTDIEKLNERIDALEGHESYQNTAIANLQESQDVQDGAIEDLGMAVSEIVGEE